MTTTTSARLVTTLAAPLGPDEADAPSVLRWPGRRLLVQRGDRELVAYDVDELVSSAGEPAVTRFRAPWPRRFGTATVAPGRDLAVFAGVHALRAVEPSGVVRWEVGHGCWDYTCRAAHTSFDDYARSADHNKYGDSGSAVFSADGSTVWAHVRLPRAADETPEDLTDEWLVLGAADGRVLARVDILQTEAGTSRHRLHPDPRRMGLDLDMGQHGQHALWGHWDGQRLTFDSFSEEDRVLLAASPSGDRFMTVSYEQDVLALHSAADGSVLAELEAESVAPSYEEPDDLWWNFGGGFLDARTAITGVTESSLDVTLHWLVDVARMQATGPISYPFPVAGTPEPLGDGIWYTVTEAGDALHLWSLRD